MRTRRPAGLAARSPRRSRRRRSSSSTRPYGASRHPIRRCRSPRRSRRHSSRRSTTSQRRFAIWPPIEATPPGGEMSTGTQVEVVMPQMGVSVSEGTITRWLKQPGDTIARDEPLLEISTDKVDTEVPSPGEGVLAEIRVQEGETVEVGTVLAVIAPEVSAVEDSAVEDAAEDARAARAGACRSGRGSCRCGRSTQRGCRAAERASGADTCASRQPPTAGWGERQDIRLAGRRTDRGRAWRRSGRHPRHRSGRPRHEEGHPRLHRVRRGGSAAGTCSAGAK